MTSSSDGPTWFSNGRHQPPGRHAVTRLGTDLAVDGRIAVKDSLGCAVGPVSLYFDIWTGGQRRLMAGLVNFVAADWRPVERVFVVEDLGPLHHTSDNIRERIIAALADFALKEEDLFLSCTDNGANMVAAVLGLTPVQAGCCPPGCLSMACLQCVFPLFSHSACAESIRCAAHTLHLAVQSMLKLPACDELMVAVRLLAKHFRKSLLATNELHGIQSQMGKELRTLPKDCATRWTGARDVLQRLLQCKAELTQYLLQPHAAHVRLSAGQWLLAQELDIILDSAALATKMLQATLQVTLSCIHPCVDRLMRILSDIPKEFSAEGAAAMDCLRKEIHTQGFFSPTEVVFRKKALFLPVLFPNRRLCAVSIPVPAFLIRASVTCA